MSQGKVEVGQVYADRSKWGRLNNRTVVVVERLRDWRRWRVKDTRTGRLTHSTRLGVSSRWRLVEPEPCPGTCVRPCCPHGDPSYRHPCTTCGAHVEPEQPATVEVLIGVALCACGERFSSFEGAEDAASYLDCCNDGERSLSRVRARIPKPQPRPVAEVKGEVVS